jgi:60 kDa SS-A/Ro ribonucleoprotein
MDYASQVSKKVTPQSEKAREDQVENSAGGFVFKLSNWDRLDRFLVLGNEGGTYYAGERKLTKENASCIEACLNEDGVRAVTRIAELSASGSIPKNDTAIFALALASAHADDAVRSAAFKAMPAVCRIGTHLFDYASACDHLRGWGTGLKRAIASWYLGKKPEDVMYQVAKYRQRNGWSHKDMLRLSHVTPTEPLAPIFRWVVDTELGERVVLGSEKRGRKQRQYAGVGELPEYLEAFNELQTCNEKRAIELVQKYGFTREMLQTEHLNSVDVWAALLPKMPVTATLRNLGKMTSIGLLDPLSEGAKVVTARLTDPNILKKGRVHPIAILMAQAVYAQGRGIKGSLTWSPNRAITDSLDDAFYLAFQGVEPTGKNILLALDVSGSMTMHTIAGATGLTARKASAAMAMVTAKSEKNWHIVAFSCGSGGAGYGRINQRSGGWTADGTSNHAHLGWFRRDNNDGITPIDITPKMRLDQVTQTLEHWPFGGTDVALPVLYALDKKMSVDAFITYTDNETWQGAIHPHQALEMYRKETGIAAKMVAVGMTATEYSVCDPNDPASMNVVGFDASAPAIMADFIRG